MSENNIAILIYSKKQTGNQNDPSSYTNKFPAVRAIQ
jgi:hypothetical protein